MKFHLLLITILIFFSCKKEDKQESSNIPTASNQLLPLKAGSSWSYVGKEFTENGTVKSTSNSKLIVTGTAKKKNKTYFIITEAAFLNDTLLLIRSDEKTVWVYSEDINNEFVYYKWPVAEGETTYNIKRGQYKEEGIGSILLVTINSYEGYKVIHNVYYNNQLSSYSEIYFKPQLGMIGSLEYNMKSDNTGLYKQYESQLVSYNLK